MQDLPDGQLSTWEIFLKCFFIGYSQNVVKLSGSPEMSEFCGEVYGGSFLGRGRFLFYEDG